MILKNTYYHSIHTLMKKDTDSYVKLYKTLMDDLLNPSGRLIGKLTIISSIADEYSRLGLKISYKNLKILSTLTITELEKSLARVKAIPFRAQYQLDH